MNREYAYCVPASRPVSVAVPPEAGIATPALRSVTGAGPAVRRRTTWEPAGAVHASPIDVRPIEEAWRSRAPPSAVKVTSSGVGTPGVGTTTGRDATPAYATPSTVMRGSETR